MRANCKLALAAMAGVVSCASVIATQALAGDLPKSGSFTVHTGWKGISEVTQVDEKHTISVGRSWGVAFDDTGSGPLHMGPAFCTSASEVIEGAGTVQGKCAWSDTEGDKIFTDWSGKSTPSGELSGMNTITGGTGKFAGIQGKAPFQCKVLNTSGQIACKQQFEYQLTAEATGTSTSPAGTPK